MGRAVDSDRVTAVGGIFHRERYHPIRAGSTGDGAPRTDNRVTQSVAEGYRRNRGEGDIQMLITVLATLGGVGRR